MKIFIKYMVSTRCIMIVKEELKKLNIPYDQIELGLVTLENEINESQRVALAEVLQPWGLELLDDKRSILIERVKNIIISMIYPSTHEPMLNYSEYISNEMGYDYHYLAHIFSEVKGITIQQYIINIKIEKVKELLLYDELSLTEIAYKLHYSSVAHLSNQFKKQTGLTATYFKKLGILRKGKIEDF